MSINNQPDGPEIASELIKHYEQCSLVPYQRDGDVPTIGWGNTRYINGTAVTMNDTAITQEQADNMFLFFLRQYSIAVISHLPGSKPNEQAAFISFAYNVGVNAFLRSSALTQYLLGNKPGVKPDLALWNESNGRVLKGLQRRRLAEGLVFNGVSVMTAVRQAEVDYP